ncbi:hypothetical protein Gohar_021203 [Gossypium harknessii]|uniref:DUF7745 domain-containing protein n=1 Tax=Gossypium harknessii TaxID=34285 RepID=A0A7J9ICK8_9ROSI|nr:hypothetical protein [Gossypium harknessii]
MKVDKHLFRALTQYWNSSYSCFTFGRVDLVPTVEEYTTLLRCPKIQVDKAYSRATNDLILAHPDVKKRVDVFALSIYGLIVFPKVLGHVDETVSDLFDRLNKGVTPILAILAETFRSLSACRRASEGRFIGCAQLLLAWFYSHFWNVEKVSYRFFSENYSLLKELVATPRRDDISEEKWMAIFRISKRTSRQFTPAMQGLAQCEFSYKGDNYKKKVREISNAWNQTYRMKIFVVNPMMTPKYSWWRGKRINDNISASSQEDVRPIKEHLQVIPSESEIIK